MARSSSVDAVEKFRFSLFILNLSIDPVSLSQTFATGFLRGGFSEVTLPSQSTTAIEYRENVDATHPQLIAGITRYDPVSLRRGVTKSSDFHRWANQVHDAEQIIASGIQRISGDPHDKPPSESLNYRRDVVIVTYDRSGNTEKGWLLRDAWVSNYKPGDNLSALGDDAKLIEEIELRYESFEELTREALISGGINSVLGGL